MAVEIVLPKLGLTMTEGKINRWLKEEGEQVQKGEGIVEISTEKATTEVESPQDGVLGKILVSSGNKIPVGKVIGIVIAQGEEVPEKYLSTTEDRESPSQPQTETDEEKTAKPDAVKVETRDPRKEQAPPIRLGQKIKASPKAKKMAQEYNIDLAQMSGTGPSGRILSRDVEKALAHVPESKKEEESPEGIAPSFSSISGETHELSGIRKVIADRMSQSFHDKPHVTLNIEIEMTEFLNLKDRLKEHLAQSQLSITLNDLLVKVVTQSLKNHPEINGTIEGDRVLRAEEINLGVAVATSDGLVVPVLKDVVNLTLTEIGQSTKNLIKKARHNQLKQEEIEGGTFTITNLGMYEITNFTPIINPPEIAILGIGKIKETPVVKDNQVTTGHISHFSLSFDHRAIDGAQGAEFLKTVKLLIENPETLWTI